MLLTGTHIDRDEFTARTGWAIKPEGACKGGVCVPLPEGDLDARVLSERLGMPIVEDRERNVSALGPETGITGHVLTTAQVPELVLPDADGNPFALSTLRGQKVLLVAWASW
jgi:hypothetical protein